MDVFRGNILRNLLEENSVWFNLVRVTHILSSVTKWRTPRPKVSRLSIRSLRVDQTEVSSQAAFTRQTKVGKLKLVCVNGTKTVGAHVGKLLTTNRTCLYSRQLFHQPFRVGKLVFDACERLANVCW